MRRLLIDSGSLIAASALMLIVVIVGGQFLGPTTPLVSAESERAQESTCLEQPLGPVGDRGNSATPVSSLPQAMSSLCLTRDGVHPTVELTHLPNGMLYTAWLAYLEQPRTPDVGRCASAQLAGQAGSAMPGRIGSGTVDRSGRIVLSAAFPGLHLEGNSEAEILVVEHGQVEANRTAASARHLLLWDAGWTGMSVLAPAEGETRPRLVGCASYWMRGGPGLLEH